MRFKINWASLKLGGKFTVFALFYFVFEGNFPSTSHRGAYIWRGDLTEGFLRYRFGGLIHGGAYFRNFTVLVSKFQHITPVLCELHRLPIQYRIIFKILLLVYKSLNGTSPSYLA